MRHKESSTTTSRHTPLTCKHSQANDTTHMHTYSQADIHPLTCTNTVISRHEKGIRQQLSRFKLVAFLTHTLRVLGSVPIRVLGFSEIFHDLSLKTLWRPTHSILLSKYSCVKMKLEQQRISSVLIDTGTTLNLLVH